MMEHSSEGQDTVDNSAEVEHADTAYAHGRNQERSKTSRADDSSDTDVLSWVLRAGAVATALIAIAVLGQKVKDYLVPTPPP
jgi:hypothetical protein